MKKLPLALFSALALGLSGLAYADHYCDQACNDKHCDYKKHGMADADANKDGVISREEFSTAHQARANKMFDAMDANKDGQIDADERKAKGHGKDRCKMKSPKLYDKEDKGGDK